MERHSLKGCLSTSVFANSCVTEYLTDFYGQSALWYAIVQILFSLLIIFSDFVFLCVFLSSSVLRKTAANWLLVGLILTDCFHYVCLGSGAIVLLVGYIKQPREHVLLCQVVGSFAITTATCSFGFPGLIAAQRYYKISYVPTIDAKFSIANSIFSDSRLIPLMIGWLVFSVAINLPLTVFFHSFGEDPNGYCGVKPFIEILPLLLFILATVTMFTLSYTLTGVYYYRLGQFLQTERTTSTNRDSVSYLKLYSL